LAAEYLPVADEDYEPDNDAAAMLGPGAFRKILQRVYSRHATVMHVHRHDHFGRPRASRIDDVESRKFIPDFWKVCPNHPHGTLILSLDSMSGLLWHQDRTRIVPLSKYVVVQDPLLTLRGP
jgi:hypothetical protein